MRALEYDEHHLHDIRQAEDDHRALRTPWKRKGFLAPHTAAGATAAQSAVGNPFLFTGREWDGETGLYYYRARSYDITTGRFAERDGSGFVDGLSLYEPFHSNPASRRDPLGLDDEEPSLVELREEYENALYSYNQEVERVKALEARLQGFREFREAVRRNALAAGATEDEANAAAAPGEEEAELERLIEEAWKSRMKRQIALLLAAGEYNRRVIYLGELGYFLGMELPPLAPEGPAWPDPPFTGPRVRPREPQRLPRTDLPWHPVKFPDYYDGPMINVFPLPPNALPGDAELASIATPDDGSDLSTRGTRLRCP